MSFSAENLVKKLQSLTDTQESIVSISQWILFHQRHVATIAQVWSDTILKTSSTKKLGLLYLCNEVVQQARAKRKNEFIVEFGKVLPLVTYKSYGEVNEQIQGKLERLIGVWESRNIFPTAVINNLNESVKRAKNGTKTAEEKSSVALAPELTQLSELYNKISSSNSNNVSYMSKLTLEYNNLFEADQLPAPKIYLTKLQTIELLCEKGLKGIDDTIQQRKHILRSLEALTNSIKENIAKDEAKTDLINEKLQTVWSTQTELREMIGEPAPSNTIKPQPIVQPIQKQEEDPSPVLDSDSDSDVPMYENGSSSDENDDDDDEPSRKRAKTPQSSKPSAKTTPRSLTPDSRKVQFNDDIEINQIEVENQIRDNDDEEDGKLAADAVSDVPKDSPLLHKQGDNEEDDDDDGYDPSETLDPPTVPLNVDVMSILSKLANNK